MTFKLLPAALALALLTCAQPLPHCRAQTPSAGGARREGFGASLKKKGAGRSEARDGETQPPGEGAAVETVRVDTLLTVHDVVVTDAKGTRFVEGLTKDDFVVFEDDRPQQVDSLTLGDDAARLPRSIVLIIDRSPSLRAFLDESMEAAKKLVSQLAPADEMAIVTDDVHLACGFTKDKKRLRETLDSLKKLTKRGWHSRSQQFSALLATLRELFDDGRRRPIIIFQTDGDQAHALARFEEGGTSGSGQQPYGLSTIMREAERSRVKIYTVIPSERLLGLTEEEAASRWEQMAEKRRRVQEEDGDYWYGMRRVPDKPPAPKEAAGALPFTVPPEVLKQIQRHTIEMFLRGQEAAVRVAEVTGGWAAFLEEPARAGEIYQGILADINHRYLLSYYPTNKARDGRLRRVRVEVRGHPEYRVQGRTSYYAAAP
jgi:VWFA-related protein